MVARQPHDDEVREVLLPIPARDRVGEQSCSGRVGNGQHEPGVVRGGDVFQAGGVGATSARPGDRKSTRLNSSHGYISYAVFCLKKKNVVRVTHASSTDP